MPPDGKARQRHGQPPLAQQLPAAAGARVARAPAAAAAAGAQPAAAAAVVVVEPQPIGNQKSTPITIVWWLISFVGYLWVLAVLTPLHWAFAFCMLFAPLLGAHRFYLGDYWGGFSYVVTLGFGFRPVEVFCLTSMTEEANRTGYNMESIKIQANFRKGPDFVFNVYETLTVGAAVFLVCWLVLVAFPQEPEYVVPYQSVIRWTLSTLVTVTLLYKFSTSRFLHISRGWIVVATVVVGYLQYLREFNGGVTIECWPASFVGAAIMTFLRFYTLNKMHEQPARFRKLFVLLGLLAVTGCICSGLYFNATVGEERPTRLRDAIAGMYKSGEIDKLKSQAWDAVMLIYNEGWGRFMEQYDVSGERRAMRVLGISDGNNTTMINDAHKKLIRQYHPDKCELPGDECAVKFQEIQEAFELLT